MGCKIVPKGTCFPAEARNGVLTVVMGSMHIKKEFKYLKDDYPMSDSSFMSEKIAAILHNDNKMAVIRWNGSLSLYTHELALCGFANTGEFDIRGNIRILRKCAVLDGNTDLLYEVWIYLLQETGEIIFDAVNSKSYLVLKAEKNKGFLEDLQKATYFFPVFRFIEGKYCRMENTTGDEVKYVLDGVLMTPARAIPCCSKEGIICM